MSRAFRRGTIAAVLILAIAGSAWPRHIVWERENVTQLLWNRENAFILVGRVRTGWAGIQLAFAWQLVRQYVFRLPTWPSKRIDWVSVFHIIDDEVRQYDVDRTTFGPYEVYEGQLYGPYQGGLGRWTGTGFERVPVEEARRIVAAGNNVVFSDVDGWSGRVNLLAMAPGATREYPMRLADRDLVLRTSKSTDGLTRSIELHHGTTRETIWTIYEGPHYVSAGDYECHVREAGPSAK